MNASPKLCPGTPHRGHARAIDACPLEIAARRGERASDAGREIDARDIKNVYEQIDVVLSTMNGHEAWRDEERENVEWLSELVLALTGLDSNGHINDDRARVGRAAALQWLRAIGYITQ